VRSLALPATLVARYPLTATYLRFAQRLSGAVGSGLTRGGCPCVQDDAGEVTRSQAELATHHGGWWQLARSPSSPPPLSSALTPGLSVCTVDPRATYRLVRAPCFLLERGDCGALTPPPCARAARSSPPCEVGHGRVPLHLQIQKSLYASHWVPGIGSARLRTVGLRLCEI
jgi:hypothetical protein